MAQTDQDHEHDRTWHPGAAEYVQIGVILAVLTAIEVALFFADIPRAVTIPGLIALTIAKFVLVVAWFMHLRFDNRLFRRVFGAGVVLAGILFTVVIVIMFLSVPMAQG